MRNPHSRKLNAGGASQCLEVGIRQIALPPSIDKQVRPPAQPLVPRTTTIFTAPACEILGVSRQRLQQLPARPDFPEPVAELALGRVWETTAIRACPEDGRLVHEDEGDDAGE